MSTSSRSYAKDGRILIAEACALGHRIQAMECPACHEAISGAIAESAWWQWFAKRYPKHKARVAELKGK